MNELLIATNNWGKLTEFQSMFGDLPVRLMTLGDLAISESVEETGESFAENASIKASFYAKLGRLPALADDSGLVIDHLNGEPGVRSARYAGDGASDAERMEKVLMAMLGATDRSARFVCLCALADLAGNIVSMTEGVCEGTIAERARGANGFGYDPIFVPVGFDKTFGELRAEIKHSISHRAQAIKKMIPFLQGFFKI